MKLSSNFSLEELCKSSVAEVNGIVNKPSNDEIEKLRRLCVGILQPIRDKWGEKIFVNSGYRNPVLNRLVGGSTSSQHLKGEAVDITCGNNKKLFNLISAMITDGEIVVGQLIDEKQYSWIHISLPNNKHKNNILHL